jgi:hypothetical protein
MCKDMSLRPCAAAYLTLDAAHAEVFDSEEFGDALFGVSVSRQMGPMPRSFVAEMW